jgi:hypothetical protein
VTSGARQRSLWRRAHDPNTRRGWCPLRADPSPAGRRQRRRVRSSSRHPTRTRFKTLAVACHESLAPCALPPARRLDVGAAARALAWPSARVAPWAPSADPDLCGRPNPRAAEPAPPGSADIGRHARWQQSTAADDTPPLGRRVARRIYGRVTGRWPPAPEDPEAVPSVDDLIEQGGLADARLARRASALPRGSRASSSS